MSTSLIRSLQGSGCRGAPIDTTALRRLGISSALAHEYVKSGWLERLGRGVFQFAGDRLEREATLKFLETKSPGLHVAAKSALARHGFQQNIPHEERLILWGSRKGALPDWFVERFPVRYSAACLFDDNLPPDLCLAPMADMPEGPRVSSPERALLEMLSEVGVYQEVDEAMAIMESVRQLRSRQLGVLLKSCRMIKTIRLCVSWAAQLELPWADAASEAASERMGTSRWVKRMKDGSTLILKPR